MPLFGEKITLIEYLSSSSIEDSEVSGGRLEAFEIIHDLGVRHVLLDDDLVEAVGAVGVLAQGVPGVSVFGFRRGDGGGGSDPLPLPLRPAGKACTS